MPGNLVDRVKHCEITDPLLLQLRYKMTARAAKFVVYGWRHQLSAQSNISPFVRSRCSGVTDMYPSATAL